MYKTKCKLHNDLFRTVSFQFLTQITLFTLSFILSFLKVHRYFSLGRADNWVRKIGQVLHFFISANLSSPAKLCNIVVRQNYCIK